MKKNKECDSDFEAYARRWKLGSIEHQYQVCHESCCNPFHPAHKTVKKTEEAEKAEKKQGENDG